MCMHTEQARHVLVRSGASAWRRYVYMYTCTYMCIGHQCMAVGRVGRERRQYMYMYMYMCRRAPARRLSTHVGWRRDEGGLPASLVAPAALAALGVARAIEDRWAPVEYIPLHPLN